MFHVFNPKTRMFLIDPHAPAKWTYHQSEAQTFSSLWWNCARQAWSQFSDCELVNEYRKEIDFGPFERVEYSDGNTWFSERYVCDHCKEQHDVDGTPYQFADQRYSFGIYAGRYCDECWAKSGFIDAPASEFDPYYAGESLEEDE